MKERRYDHWFRWTLIGSSAFFLIHSLIYGPGRGFPAYFLEYEQQKLHSYLKLFVYLCFLVGAIFSSAASRWGVIFLALGLVGRGIMEVCLSVARVCIEAERIVFWSAMTAVLFYLFSFILPSKLFLDQIRRLKSSAD